jgi:hypothetical protein
VPTCCAVVLEEVHTRSTYYIYAVLALVQRYNPHPEPRSGTPQGVVAGGRIPGRWKLCVCTAQPTGVRQTLLLPSRCAPRHVGARLHCPFLA